MTLRLGVLSDIHWCRDRKRQASWHDRFDFSGVEGRVVAALDHFERLGVDATVVLGNVCHDGDQASVDEFVALCAARLSGPLLVVAGNHDPVDWAPQTVSGRLHDALPIAEIPIDRDPVRGTIRAAATHIEITGPVVFLSHYPLSSQEELFRIRGVAYSGSLECAAPLAEHLSSRQDPSVVLCGHLHARASDARGALLQLTLAALIEPPCEYAIVEISELNDKHIVVRRTSHALATGTSTGPVFAPADETWESSGGTWRPLQAQQGWW